MAYTTFEAGKEYEAGVATYGDQPTVKCVSRTAKFVTLSGVCGAIKLKIQSSYNDSESVTYFGDIIKASEEA